MGVRWLRCMPTPPIVGWADALCGCERHKINNSCVHPMRPPSATGVLGGAPLFAHIKQQPIVDVIDTQH